MAAQDCRLRALPPLDSKPGYVQQFSPAARSWNRRPRADYLECSSVCPGKSVADGMDGRAGLGDHVRCHTNLGQGDTDQAIASDDLGQLVLAPALGPFRADGHHHEPMLLVGILHPDLDLFWQ